MKVGDSLTVLACLPENCDPRQSRTNPRNINLPITILLDLSNLLKTCIIHSNSFKIQTLSKTEFYSHFLITATMANKPPSIPAGDGSPKRISRWKSVIDMLLGNRAIFQNRTGRTPSLDNIRDNHELRGLLRSDPNQAPYLSRMPNRAQDDHRRASGTIPSAAAQPGAQQPRWGGPGGKKMYISMSMMTEEHANPHRTPRVLAAYEVTQRHLQQPFHPIDLFREMWGDNHAEPAFWSGYASTSTNSRSTC